MKHCKKHFIYAIIIFFSSCGGVISNIEQYDYPVPEEELIKCVDKVLAHNPDLLLSVNSGIYTQKDTTLKSMGQTIVINDDKKYILRFSILNINKRNSHSIISLNSGAEYGNILPLAPNINYFKKRKLQKLFEEHFLSKLNKEIKKGN